VVIGDGLPAHRSRRVAQFVESQAHGLRLVRLPAYAPELNPVEYLWVYLKNGTTAN
jgi:transposase